MATVLNVLPPFPYFLDTDGTPMDDGNIYVGASGTNPLIEANRIAVFSDSALTVPLAQPVKTLGGYPVLNGTPTRIYAGATDYSIVVTNKRGDLVYASLSNPTLVGSINSINLHYDQTPPEQAVAVVPTDFSYPAGNPRRQGAVGDGVANDRAAFNTQNSTGEQIYVTRGTYLINSNLTISSPIAIENGAVIKVPTGVTVTISGNLRAGRYPIFQLAGTGQVLFTQASNGEVYPEWWYDGSGDYSAAFNYALTSLNSVQVVNQNGAYVNQPNVAQAVKMACAAYPIKKPILLPDKGALIGSGYASLILPQATFAGSAAIVNYNDFVGSIAGGVLTVTQMNAGKIAVGQVLSSGTWNASSAGTTAAVPPNVTITGLGTGTGGVGTYNISNGVINVASQNLQTLSAQAFGFWTGSLVLEHFGLYDKFGISNTMGLSWLSAAWDSIITDVTIAGFFRSGAKFDSCYGLDVRRLSVYNCAQQGGQGNIWCTATSTLDRMTSSQFRGCKSENAPVGVYGITMEHCSAVDWESLTNQSNGYGISFMDCGQCLVNGSYLEDTDREITTLQYNGVSSNQNIRIQNCGYARATYTTPNLLNGCVDTIIDNCTNGTPGVPFVSANANAFRWKLINCGSLGGSNGAVSLGAGRRTLLRDDFCANALDPRWNTSGTGAGAFQNLKGGVYRLTTGNVNGNSFSLDAGPNFNISAGDSFTIEGRFRLNNLPNVTYRPISLENAGKYIRVYANNGAGATNVVLEVNDAATTSAVASLVIDTNWHVLRVEVLNGVARLYIDGVLGATCSTNVPTAALKQLHYLVTNAAVAVSMDIDYVDLEMDRSVAP